MTQMNTFSESDVLLPYQKRWVADDSDLKLPRNPAVPG